MMRLRSKPVPSKKAIGGKNSDSVGAWNPSPESSAARVMMLGAAMANSAISCFGAWSASSRGDERMGWEDAGVRWFWARPDGNRHERDYQQ